VPFLFRRRSPGQGRRRTRGGAPSRPTLPLHAPRKGPNAQGTRGPDVEVTACDTAGSLASRGEGRLSHPLAGFA
jgi:hypothetical protein